MIVKEFFKTRKDGKVLFRTYSDQGCCVLQNETREVYEEAIDVEGAPYTYQETDIKTSEYEEH